MDHARFFYDFRSPEAWLAAERVVHALGTVPEVIPVDLHIPGCPPDPTAMLRGLLSLLEQADARSTTS